LLAPYLVLLTRDERHDLPKMSEKSLSFISKVNDYCASNPEFVPTFLDAAELDKDFEAVAALKEFSRLEPGVIDNKYYARGIGEIKQVTRKGAQEFQQLVSITH